MSKRGAGFGGDEERYGPYGGAQITMETNDKPMQATQAQMARRKIAAAKKTTRPGASRGASPFTPAPALNANTPGMFGNPLQQPQATFNSNVDGFNFGQNNQQDSQNGSPAPFQFQGAPTQQNVNNPFAQQHTQNSFGSTFNSTAPQQQQNGFNQPPSATTSSFQFSTGQPTGTPATSTFGSFGQKPAESTQNTQNSTFTFGASQQEAPKSQSTIFGGFGQSQPAEKASTPTFGSFGQQAQTNGDKASTPSFGGFGQTQNGTEKASTPFGGFGQSQKAPEQASTPAFGSFGQSQKEPEKATTSLFGGFGQTATTNGAQTATPSNPTFGQAAKEPEKAGNIFANFGQKKQEESVKTSNPFANFGQSQQQAPSMAQPETNEKLDKPLFGASQAAQATPKAATTSLFGGAPQPPQTNGAPKGLFGASVAPPVSSTPGGGSIFDSIPKKPSSTFVFSSADPSQVYREEDDDDAEDTAAIDKPATNLFAKFGNSQVGSDKSASQETPKTGLFAGLNKPQQNGDKAQEAPKSFFAPLSAAAPPAQQTPKPIGLGGALFQAMREDPRYSTKINADAPVKNLLSAAAKTPVFKPLSLADRMDDPSEASRKLGRHVSFDNTKENTDNTTGNTSAAAASTPSTSRPLFGQTNPSTSAPASTPAPALFQPQPAQSTNARPSSPLKNSFMPSPSPAQMSNSAHARRPSPSSLGQSQTLTVAQQLNMKRLNNSLLEHLKKADPSKDWSSVFDYASAASASIRGVAPTPTEKASVTSQPQSTSSAPANMFAAPSANVNGFPTAPAAATSMQTPNAAATNLFSKPPSTAPQPRKRMFEEDDDEPAHPATEKRSKPNEQPKKRTFEADDDESAQSSAEKRAKPNEPSYPKLPDTASKTARLFQATLDSPTAQPAKSGGFTPSTSLFTAASPAKQDAPSQLFQTPSAAPKAAPAAPTATPKAAGFAPAGGFVPTGGFKPSAGPPAAGGGGFLSSFGAKAKKTEDEERKKRMDEDYDSEDETKEQWEERDRKEQEAKRQKILEAAKASSGFKLPGATVTTESAASAAPTPAEKSQGSGDHTWKPETPIKFGGFGATTSTTPAVPPPSFLFGKPATSATPSTPLFGQKATGASATPGVTATPAVTSITTNADNNDDSGEAVEDASDRKGDDFAGLLPEEKQANGILAELENVKTSKLEETDNVDPKTGKKTKVWSRKATGRLFVLKNKETGKTRVLAKAPQGQVLLNYEPVKGMKAPNIAGNKKTMVTTGFFDHIHASPPAMGQFAFMAKDAEDAATLARLLEEGSR